MLGTFDASNKDAVVVGGGIAGLLLTHRLLELGYKVELHEATNRLGGLIQTYKLENGISEAAAHSFLASPPVLDLCKNLGVELCGINEKSNARYIFRDGKARRIPLGFFEILKTLWRLFTVKANPLHPTLSMTMQEWGNTFIGKPALDYALNPFIRGIYGAKPEELTVGAAFPKLAIGNGQTLVGFLRSQKKNTPRAPHAQMVAPKLGMEDLCKKLEVKIRSNPKATVFLNSKINELPVTSNVAVCTEMSSATRLIGTGNSVPYAPIVSVTAMIQATQKWSGIGTLVPENQKLRCMGILFNSSAFLGRALDDSKTESYTLMFGGSVNPDLVNLNDDEVSAEVKKAFIEILKMEPEIQELKIHRWKNAIPKYGRDLEVYWKTAKTGWCSKPGRVLFGNYTGQVSIRGMIEEVSQLK